MAKYKWLTPEWAETALKELRSMPSNILDEGKVAPKLDYAPARKAKALDMARLYDEGKTLQEVGEHFGVTRERVRQVLASIGHQRRTPVESHRLHQRPVDMESLYNDHMRRLDGLMTTDEVLARHVIPASRYAVIVREAGWPTRQTHHRLIRRCSQCRQVKPNTAQYFSGNHGTFSSRCKVCTCENTKRWYAQNKHRTRDWQMANRDRLREYQRRYSESRRGAIA